LYLQILTITITIQYFDNTPVESFVVFQKLLKVDALSIFDSLNYILVNKLNLLTAIDLLTGLTNTLSEYRSNDNDFEVVYNDTLKVWMKFNIEIPELRKWTISFRVNPNKK